MECRLLGFAVRPRSATGCSWTGWTARAALLERVAQIFGAGPMSASSCPGRFVPAGRPPLDAPPCADLADQLLDNDVTPASAFRAEALGVSLRSVARMPGELGGGEWRTPCSPEGWTAVTLPESLATARRGAWPDCRWPEATLLRAIRSRGARRIRRDASSRTTLDLVQEYVPLPRAMAPLRRPRPARDATSLRSSIPGRSQRALRSRVGDSARTFGPAGTSSVHPPRADSRSIVSPLKFLDSSVR